MDWMQILLQLLSLLPVVFHFQLLLLLRKLWMQFQVVQSVVHTPAAPAAPAEAAANFLSGNTAIPAQPSAESVAQLVQQSAAIVQGH